MDESVTLLLKATAAKNVTNKAAREKAIPITRILGYLALAIVQAGAYIQKGLCSIEEYCDVYTRRRQKLLKHLSIQASSDYKYSVYTTWEISIEAIENMGNETSRNAIELIQVFCFLHYDGIAEDIFERAWSNRNREPLLFQDITHMFYMRSQEALESWDATLIREAAVLLASFSLIKIKDDEIGRRMSMHPLVHVWARDRLSEELQRCSWITASSTLGVSMSFWGSHWTDIRFRQSLLLHIESCINLCSDQPFFSNYSGLSRIEMAKNFAFVFSQNGRMQEAMELEVKVLETVQRTLGSEHPYTLSAMSCLANSYSGLRRKQEATELSKKVLETRQRTLGNKHKDTLLAMSHLASQSDDLKTKQEFIEWGEKMLEVKQRTLGSEHQDTYDMMDDPADIYIELGRKQKAIELKEKMLKIKPEKMGNKDSNTFWMMCTLVFDYSDVERDQEAIKLAETLLKTSQKELGNEHPGTLDVMEILEIVSLRFEKRKNK